MVYYKAGVKTGEVELEAGKESENHLPDSLAHHINAPVYQ